MTKEEFRDAVKKVMGIRGEVYLVEWVKLTDGQYHIRVAIKANARQVAKLKPILAEYYQQDLT